MTFLIVKNTKISRCPSVDELFYQMWYIYIMEYSSAIQGSDLLYKWQLGISKRFHRGKTANHRRLRIDGSVSVILLGPQMYIGGKQFLNDCGKQELDRWRGERCRHIIASGIFLLVMELSYMLMCHWWSFCWNSTIIVHGTDFGWNWTIPKPDLSVLCLKVYAN